MAKRLIVLAALMAFGAVFAAPAANAEFGIARWEALTCKSDTTTPGLGNWAANGSPCLKSEPERQYTQAAGHPNKGITAFLMNQVVGPPALPDGFIKDIRVELPPGLAVNPEATAKCTEKQLSEVIATEPIVLTKCATEAPTSQVGVDYLTTLAPGPVPPKGTEVTVPSPVYNIVGRPGVPSMAGFNASGEPSYLVGDLDPVDQHVSFNTTGLKSPLLGGAPVIGSRLVFEGQTGDGYLTLPTSCSGPQVTDLHVVSHPYPLPPEGAELERSAEAATPTGATGCNEVPFKPTIAVNPDGPKATDSPEPITVDLGIPYEKGKPGGLINSYLKTAKVTLPEGMGINPSSAALTPCTDAQFHKGTNLAVECPKGSEIGTVKVETPSLPVNSVGGTVYLAAPLKNGPGASGTGEQFRIFIHASGPERGVNVRLVGNVFPNATTGQVTAVVDENPEAPFSSFQLRLNGGPQGTLTTPGSCGPNTTTTDLTPWSGNISPPLAEPNPKSSFTLTNYPGGGKCPATLAARPFAPAYTAKTDSAKAGAYSPFRVHIGRPDGQQELKVVNVTLPKGLTGNLSGIPYCSEAALAAAAASSGKAELANSSCSAASQLGTTSTESGTGANPIKLAGKAFLAGPYKGAPLSLATITPAVAGPFDLGTVVVRVALNVNPETAQINAVSDLIPDVFGGVKLDIRSIDVNVDRSKFMLNPTNCAAQATSGVINGGGANPANPAAFSSYAVNAPFQATECNKLGFKPTLHTRLYGPVTRAKNPRIRAILEARAGDANLSRAALTLPHSLFLDQSHIKTVCTRVQLAAQACPKASVYGHAEAKTPLLDGKLKGPVYLVSSSHELPDLLADLRGQVNVQLHGVISSKHGGIKTVFNPLPDVPVTKFILNMQGGKKSLLENSTNLCKHKQSSVMNLKGQNGKKLKKNKLPLRVTNCQKKK
jgi:hypothetical protein